MEISKEKAVKKLTELKDHASLMKQLDPSDSEVTAWKRNIIVAVRKIFGESHVTEISQTVNAKHTVVYSRQVSISQQIKDYHLIDCKAIIGKLESMISEILDWDVGSEKNEDIFSQGVPPLWDNCNIGARINDNISTRSPKIFISHAHKDAAYANALVQLLNDIGIPKTQKSIFCSSVKGYGIPVGENIYDYLREQFHGYDLFVFFLLSENYYQSPACLNEMGIAWGLRKNYLTILLPGFNYSQIAGAIDPRRLSIKLDDGDTLETNLNNLKEQLESVFKITSPIGMSIWEGDREKFIKNIRHVNTEIVIKKEQKSIDLDNFITQEQSQQLTPMQLCAVFTNLANTVENTLFASLQKIAVLFSDFSSEATWGYSITEPNSCEHLYCIYREFGKVDLTDDGGDSPHSVFLHRDIHLSNYKHVLNDSLIIELHISMTDYTYSIGIEFSFAGGNPIISDILAGNSSSAPQKENIERWCKQIISEICQNLQIRQ